MKPPPLRNDCFAMPPGVDWTSVDVALQRLRAGLHAVTGVETVAVEHAGGRVLAKGVQAVRSNPPTANSAVDGYGFAQADLPATDPVEIPLMEGRAAAGAPFDGVVPRGSAIRILTGARVPEGVDSVVLEEDTSSGAGRIAFNAGLKRGANTRLAGEDVVVGADVLPAGRMLGAQDLALLAAVGIAEIQVHKRLRVAVLSTGDEVVPVGTAANDGQIFDANRPMLLQMIRAWGCEPVDLGHVKDTSDAVRAAFSRGARAADAVLTSGGASAGDEDHVSAVLKASGQLQTWRVAVKPGRPIAMALWDGVPVFGLPGNPVAAFVCTLVFARPALAILSGRQDFDPQGFDIPADFSKTKKPGRREYIRARIRDGRAEVFKSEGSGRISGLAWADGLVELGDDGREIRPGDLVRYYPFSSYGL